MRAELVSLLEACKQAPEDDDARLVLATGWRSTALIRFDRGAGPHRGRPAFSGLLRRAWSENERAWAPFLEDLQPSARADFVGGLTRAAVALPALTGPAAGRRAGREEWAWVARVAMPGEPLPTPISLPKVPRLPENVSSHGLLSASGASVLECGDLCSPLSLLVPLRIQN